MDVNEKDFWNEKINNIDKLAIQNKELYDTKLKALESQIQDVKKDTVAIDDCVTQLTDKFNSLNLESAKTLITVTNILQKVEILSAKPVQCVAHSEKLDSLETRVAWMFKIVVSTVIAVICAVLIRLTIAGISYVTDVRAASRSYEYYTIPDMHLDKYALEKSKKGSDKK